MVIFCMCNFEKKKMFAARKSKQAFLDSVDSKLIKP